MPAWVLEDEDVDKIEQGGSVERVYRGSFPQGRVNVVRRNNHQSNFDLVCDTTYEIRQYGKGQKRPRYERTVTFTKSADQNEVA